MANVRVGILGATGYTALELLKILLRHPDVEVTALTSRQEDRPHVAMVHPQLACRLDLCLENLPPESVAARTDVVFSCLPHAASAEVVKKYLAQDVRVIDFSADYRLDDVETYTQWYGGKHPDPDRVGNVVYGLPEFFSEQISKAQLVANPGCFPTTAIFALAPLLKERQIETHGIIVDSKTGVSGAGRNPKLMTHYPECNESVSAYNVGRHRHTPEIDQILRRITGEDVEVVFTPHLIPMDRGILTSVYAQPTKDVSEDSLLEQFREFYAAMPFVRVVDHLPATKDTYGTNFCDVTVRLVRGRVIIFSSLDNLVKGASGAAVKNFNLMCGFAETTAL